MWYHSLHSICLNISNELGTVHKSWTFDTGWDLLTNESCPIPIQEKAHVSHGAGRPVRRDDYQVQKALCVNTLQNIFLHLRSYYIMSVEDIKW